ncbi:MAG: hypothetical protein U0401_28610 [Anaerolineae bacterium]
MPILPEFFRQLQFITQESALLGLFITAALILIVRDWRTLIVALLLQYILVGIILYGLVRPDIAVLKVMIGAFICPILFLSARQVATGLTPISTLLERRENLGQALVAWWRNFSFISLIVGRYRRRRQAATGFTFRVLLSLLLVLIAVTLSNTFVLPGLSPALTTAIYWLILVGLVILTLSEDPMKAGHGLFTLLAGFDLYYTTLEKSLLITGMWGAINLLLALAIGYLTVVRGAGPEEEL